ncbi:unnamed protein product [Orchesella dallaii]|uniref:DZF domain-containing protein n=1 Tax=Orchesella dallaii TaxID=48710 RepID=A0ABP1QL25_9HEXA
MRGGGRGGIGGGKIRRNRGPVPPPHALGNMRLLNGGKLPFDLTFFEEIFPRATPAPDDSILSTALLKRNGDIAPSTEEIQVIQNLVTRIQSILETLILTPGTFDACQVDEVRQVGSFKQGTILAGHKTADFVVILKTLPTREAVEALCNRVADELRQTECVRATVTTRGFDLSNVQATVRVLITTVPHNIRKLDADIHLDAKIVNEHWQAIRHSRWFEENCHNSTVKVLIRILRDMRQRYPSFQPISTWMLDLLAHYAVMNNPGPNRQALPINVAFRRTIALMATGMYLPGYAGTSMRGHNLTYEEQDLATAASQTLLRVLAQGGYRVILGLDTCKGLDIIGSSSVWDAVVVSPLDKVYEKPVDGEQDKIDDDQDAEEDDESTMEA